jgi:hypothetical protein
MSCYLNDYIHLILAHYLSPSSQDDPSVEGPSSWTNDVWNARSVAAYEKAMKAKQELDAMPVPLTRREWKDSRPQYGPDKRTRR